ncbi:MAG: type I-E CRISPR-associated protein Cas5/CasD [Acidithiobacillus ferrivorans]
MSNPFLLLWLEAPLQSWGHDSKFGRRDTLAFPTRSGVLGLLCAAMGAGGEQQALLSEFSALGQTALSFVRDEKKSRDLHLRDFHMVGSGYNKKDPWEIMHIPKKSDGTNAVGGGAKMTYRYYLQDAAFAVALELPSDQAVRIVHAMQSPAWDIYLGRKSCAPTDFVYRGIFETESRALECAVIIAHEKSRVEDFRVLQRASADGDADEVFTLNDVPIQFGDDKRYRDRQVSLIYAR